MDRHRFDPISLVFGIIFTIAGIMLLTGGEITDDGRFLLPLGLIGLGIAVLVQAAGNRSHAEDDHEDDHEDDEGLPGEYSPSDEIGAESSEDR